MTLTYSHTKAGLRLLLFAALWCGIIAFVALVPGKRGTAPLWIVIPFGAFGLLLLWGAIRTVTLGRRYGTSTLPIEEPPRRSAQLRARFETNVPAIEQRILLRCLQGAGKGQRQIWSAEQTVPRGAPFAFHIPPDAPPADRATRVSWELSVAPADDASLVCHFDIPVA